MLPTIAVLACSTVPGPRDLAHPSYRHREAATLRLIELGPAATPLIVRLMHHRDAEVGHRARRAWESVALIRVPDARPAEPDSPFYSWPVPPWPWYERLVEAAPPVLRPAADWLVRSARSGWEGNGQAFTVEFLDSLTLNGFPVGLAQRWYDRAEGLQRRANAAPAPRPTP